MYLALFHLSQTTCKSASREKCSEAARHSLAANFGRASPPFWAGERALTFSTHATSSDSEAFTTVVMGSWPELIGYAWGLKALGPRLTSCKQLI